MSELMIDCFNYIVENSLYGFSEATDEQDIWDYLCAMDKKQMSKLILLMR